MQYFFQVVVMISVLESVSFNIFAIGADIKTHISCLQRESNDEITLSCGTDEGEMAGGTDEEKSEGEMVGQEHEPIIFVTEAKAVRLYKEVDMHYDCNNLDEKNLDNPCVNQVNQKKSTRAFRTACNSKQTCTLQAIYHELPKPRCSDDFSEQIYFYVSYQCLSVIGTSNKFIPTHPEPFSGLFTIQTESEIFIHSDNYPEYVTSFDTLICNFNQLGSSIIATIDILDMDIASDAITTDFCFKHTKNDTSDLSHCLRNVITHSSARFNHNDGSMFILYRNGTSAVRFYLLITAINRHTGTPTTWKSGSNITCYHLPVINQSKTTPATAVPPVTITTTQSSPKSNDASGLIGGVVAGVLFTILVIIILIFICCCKRNKDMGTKDKFSCNVSCCFIVKSSNQSTVTTSIHNTNLYDMATTPPSERHQIPSAANTDHNNVISISNNKTKEEEGYSTANKNTENPDLHRLHSYSSPTYNECVPSAGFGMRNPAAQVTDDHEEFDTSEVQPYSIVTVPGTGTNSFVINGSAVQNDTSRRLQLGDEVTPEAVAYVNVGGQGTETRPHGPAVYAQVNKPHPSNANEWPNNHDTSGYDVNDGPQFHDEYERNTSLPTNYPPVPIKNVAGYDVEIHDNEIYH